MLKIADIRGWIASLGIAADNRIYIGKLDNKQQKSIGVYGRGGSGPPNIALGGLDYTTYEKPVQPGHRRYPHSLHSADGARTAGCWNR